MEFKVLHIEDDDEMQEALRENLRQALQNLEGSHRFTIELISPAENGRTSARQAQDEAIQTLLGRGTEFHLIVADIRLNEDAGEPHGVRIVQALMAENRADLLKKVVVVSSWLDGGESEDTHRPECAEFLAHGVRDLWRKPIRVERIESTLVGFFGFRRKVPEAAELHNEQWDFWPADTLMGHSHGVRRYLQQVGKAARYGTGANILLLGPSGAGKSRCARAVHEMWGHHQNRGGRFIARSMAAMPGREGGLAMQADLFGVAAGHLWQGSPEQLGIFELADGGTVFLDEIGLIPSDVGAALLKVLEDGKVTRLGTQTPRRVDCWVVAATDADLEQMMEDGEFSAPLYYRLQACPIAVPSLNQCLEDVPRYFSTLLARKLDVVDTNIHLTLGAEFQLRKADWARGEFRLLNRVVERVTMAVRARPFQGESLDVLGGDIAEALEDVRAPTPAGEARQLLMRMAAVHERQCAKCAKTRGRRLKGLAGVGVNRPDQLAFLFCALKDRAAVKEASERLGLDANEISARFTALDVQWGGRRLTASRISTGEIRDTEIEQILSEMLEVADKENSDD